jgi:type I restriction enzyme S subunit
MIPVGEVLSFVGGSQPPASTFKAEAEEGYVRLVQIRDFYTSSHLTYVPDSNLLRKCAKTDVMIARYGASVGRVLRGLDGAYNVALVKATPKEGIDNNFLFYLLTSDFFQLPLLAQSARSAQAGFSRESIGYINLPCPPLNVQKSIGEILGALDDKIESNRRLIEVTEELGRHELGLALRGDDGTRWEYAWPESTLGEVLEVIESGGRPKGGVAGIEEGVPSIGAESIVRAGIFDYSKTKYVPTSFFETMNRGILQSGDVLLYKDGGTPGNFIPHVSMTQSDFPFAVAAINEHVYRLRIRQPFSQAYLYYWLSSRRMLDEMWLRGTGAAIPGLNSSNVKGLPIAVPPSERLVKILPLVDNLLLDLHQRAKESRVLANLRNTLIPELLSGRLRVKDAKSMMENV